MYDASFDHRIFIKIENLKFEYRNRELIKKKQNSNEKKLAHSGQEFD